MSDEMPERAADSAEMTIMNDDSGQAISIVQMGNLVERMTDEWKTGCLIRWRKDMTKGADSMRNDRDIRPALIPAPALPWLNSVIFMKSVAEGWRICYRLAYISAILFTCSACRTRPGTMYFEGNFE